LKHLNNILDKPLQVLIDVDPHYGRTGIPIDHLSDISEFSNAIQHCSKIALIGCYIHAGNSYQRPNKESILAFSDNLMGSITQLKNTLNLPIYYGDTPTCSLLDDFSVIDVLTPGNLFFYDLSQEYIGSCQQEDIAVWVDCPIIEVKARNAWDLPTHMSQTDDEEFAQIVIHGGAVHFSKDYLDMDGRVVYGRLKDNPSLYLDKISQEHGLIIGPKDLIYEAVGQSYLSIYPVHSCLTAESMAGYTDSKTFACYDHMKGNL
jgi:D-serine deaminase-like pyridoxal phosphate-dependent protein